MIRILLGAAVAIAGYSARKRGVRILTPWGDGCGTLGFHLSERTYFDIYGSFGKIGVFWCLRDSGGNILEKGWFNLQSGAWKIESVNGVAIGRWGYLRRCRRYENVPLEVA